MSLFKQLLILCLPSRLAGKWHFSVEKGGGRDTVNDEHDSF